MRFQPRELEAGLTKRRQQVGQGNKNSPPQRVRGAPTAWRQALLLVAVSVFSGCGEPVAIPVVGQPVADIALPNLEGNMVRLSDFRGEVVLLNFWATWCPPCVDEMPSLQKLETALGEKGLNVLAISVDENLEDVERFREEFELSLPILHDPGAKTAHRFATFKFPETYIVGRDGRLVGKVIGPRDWIAPLVIHDFVELLRGEEWDGV